MSSYGKIASELVAVELGDDPGSMQVDAAHAIAASTREVASLTSSVYLNA